MSVEVAMIAERAFLIFVGFLLVLAGMCAGVCGIGLVYAMVSEV